MVNLGMDQLAIIQRKEGILTIAKILHLHYYCIFNCQHDRKGVQYEVIHYKVKSNASVVALKSHATALSILLFLSCIDIDSQYEA